MTERPSSSTASHSNTADDETWLDFLRSAGGTVGNSSAHNNTQRPSMASHDSTDRKRRLTSAEQGREYPYTAPGSSRASAIDLTSPERRRGVSFSERLDQGRGPFNSYRRSTENRMSTSRQGSDIELPKWQPDAEVSKCPVCEQEFTFLFRKHHCRKCGRVVCAQCSPHRITIPREYIVQPAGTQQQGVMEQHVSGAEVVRVCKPCVPDPWRPTAAQTSMPSREEINRARADRQGSWHRSLDVPLAQHPDGRMQTESRYRNLPVPLQSASGVRNGSGYQPTNDTIVVPRSLQSNRGSAPLNPSSGAANHFGLPPPGTRPRGLTAPMQRTAPSTSQTQPNIPAPQRRRRDVKEEDECPVCGIELPPGDAVREEHVAACVTNRFSTPPPPSTMAPAMPTSTHDPNLPSSSTPPADTAALQARARAASYRSRGIFPYIATEKDCVDGEGREQECTICMEEFQPGDEMGRLECLCKFHKGCIREWWERKGRGSCPVHVWSE